MNSELRKVQLLQLEVLKVVTKICEKYNIKYFLTGGTLLGAIRHQAFIPWDDDLDIGMTRENYDKFIQVAQKELGEQYFLQNWDTEPNFAMPYSKIRINNTQYVEKNSANVDMNKGVYVDIFPYDNKPNSKIKRNIQKYKTYILKRLLLANLNYVLWESNQKKKKFVYKLLKVISNVIGTKRLRKMLQKETTRYSKEKNVAELVNISSSYTYEKEVLMKQWIDKLEKTQFEDDLFYIPFESEKYLSRLYGNYMELPPEDKRYNRHNIIKVDIGD